MTRDEHDEMEINRLRMGELTMEMRIMPGSICPVVALVPTNWTEEEMRAKVQRDDEERRKLVAEWDEERESELRREGH